MKIGDKVHYIRESGYIEDGIIKTLQVDDKRGVLGAFVVYDCDDNWEGYQGYTAALTRIEDLRLGWFDDDLTPFPLDAKFKSL